VSRSTTTLALILSAASSAWAAQRAVRLIAEAEDFKIEKGAWKVIPYPENYYAGTFAITFLSRMACLGAPAQVPKGEEAIATQAVEIPVESDYQVAARYEQPYNFSVEFTLEIEQDGRSVYKQTYGRLADPRIWAFNNHKRVPMERYGWGGTDNIVWQRVGTAKLAAGPATLRLIAGPQMDGDKPRKMAAERHVDVICLTNDTAGLEAQKKASYLEMDGWLVQDGDLFVRVTNPKDGLGPCVPIIKPLNEGQHSPYWVHVRDWPMTHVLKSGRLVSKTSYQIAGPRSKAVDPKLLAPVVEGANADKIPDGQFLQPGDTSGWIPMGQALDCMNFSQWFPLAKYKDAKIRELDLELEFAIPDGKGGLKSVRTARAKGAPGGMSLVTFDIPGNVAARPVIRTQLEALDWLRGEVAKFPQRGSVPKRFPVYGILEFSGAVAQKDAIGEEATKLALALGDNTITSLRSPWAEKLGVPQRRTGLLCHWYDIKLETLRKNCDELEKKGTLSQYAVFSFGDEIHIPPAKADDAAFAGWLKARGVNVEGEVKLTDDPKQPLYYYSKLWGAETGIQRYVEATQFLEQRIGKDIRTGANYSPHANYFVTDLQWVRPFKMRGMTMPWSEDYIWGVPEFSVQAAGYLTSAFRAGAKYHRLPIMMYVMPHSPGNTPRDFRLSFYTCVAHGATKINYFCASPLAVGGTENYIATDDLAMWKAVRDATHDAGVFEDYVLDGTVRPAKVGLLLSSVDEILTGDTNFKGGIHNLERKGIYFALRHAQVPVDFLTEDDVIEGLAKDYEVIYMTQQFAHSKAVRALTDWVQRGGTLVALCGGGFTDEFGKANPETAKLFGVQSQELFKDPKLPQILPKQDLPPYEPLDTAKWACARDLAIPETPPMFSLPVIAWKQTLMPFDGKVLGKFSDGKPAVVEKKHGRGRAVLFGFLPATAYLRSGLPLRPVDRGATDAGYSHFLPTEMDMKLHYALVDDFLPKGFIRPVECSERLVETTCIDTERPARLAVPLMNYTGKPIANLTVKINGLPRVRSVRSVERGELKAEIGDRAAIIRLPLDVADMLLIDR